jgi:hypothetical protein
VPEGKPYSLDISYRTGFNESAVSDGEMELINLVLPGLLVATVAGTDKEGGERHGSRALRSGIDEQAS